MIDINMFINIAIMADTNTSTNALIHSVYSVHSIASVIINVDGTAAMTVTALDHHGGLFLRKSVVGFGCYLIFMVMVTIIFLCSIFIRHLMDGRWIMMDDSRVSVSIEVLVEVPVGRCRCYCFNNIDRKSSVLCFCLSRSFSARNDARSRS